MVCCNSFCCGHHVFANVFHGACTERMQIQHRCPEQFEMLTIGILCKLSGHRICICIVIDSRLSPPTSNQLKVYAILLGDFGFFNREDFVSIFSIILAVFFTFATTTILLNVLIAVSSDSVSLVRAPRPIPCLSRTHRHPAKFSMKNA